MEDKVNNIIATNNYEISEQLKQDIEKLKNPAELKNLPEYEKIIGRIYEYMYNAHNEMKSIINKIHLIDKDSAEKSKMMNEHITKLTNETITPITIKAKEPPMPQPKKITKPLSALEFFINDFVNINIYKERGVVVVGETAEEVYNNINPRESKTPNAELFKTILRERMTAEKK